jgi:hypothetical protein
MRWEEEGTLDSEPTLDVSIVRGGVDCMDFEQVEPM